MDFETYSAKIREYAEAIRWLILLPGFKEKIGPSQLADFQKTYHNHVMALIDDVPRNPVRPTVKHHSAMDILPFLSTLGGVNLFADSVTLEQQAEAVKQQIINLGKMSNFFPHISKVPTPSRNLLTPSKTVLSSPERHDYIRRDHRDHSGTIVYPFDYWYDCIDVYLQKELYNKKTGEILKYKKKYKSSVISHDDSLHWELDSDPIRTNKKLIKKMLLEVKLLIEAVKEDKFPPMTLKGTKQQTMA